MISELYFQYLITTKSDKGEDKNKTDSSKLRQKHVEDNSCNNK